MYTELAIAASTRLIIPLNAGQMQLRYSNKVEGFFLSSAYTHAHKPMFFINFSSEAYLTDSFPDDFSRSAANAMLANIYGYQFNLSYGDACFRFWEKTQ